jgi:hypothetical protein
MWAKRSPGCDLHAHAGVTVARVPPVVPLIPLDNGRLALAQDVRPPGALHGQLTLEHGEALDKSGVAVLADHARSDERGELDGQATLGVLPRRLQDRAALTGDGILKDLVGLERSAVRRAVRVGVPHAADSDRCRTPGREALEVRRRPICALPHTRGL